MGLLTPVTKNKYSIRATQMKTTINPLICLSVLLIIFAFADISYALEIQTTSVYPRTTSQTKDTKQDKAKPSTLTDLLKQSSEEQEKEEKQKKLPETDQTSALEPQEKPLSAFEQFIAGKLPSMETTDIRQFGYDLFTEPASTITPAANIPVGPGYIVGPDDEIKITIWGNIDGEWDVIVDRDGNITLPKIGVIGITGLTFKEMQDAIYKEISRYYTGFEMNVSMGSLRSIRVYIVGNAERPGAYTVSSLSSLVSALFEAGGPSKTGSMRDIQIKRNGKALVHFDLYDLLLNGDKSKDIRLMSEDVIFIPSIGPLAGIAGNVKRPAIYELKNETKLLQFIDMAGGLSNIAFKGRVQVQRTENHKFRILFEGDLLDMGDNEGKNFLIQDGDLVKVFSVTESLSNVKLSGAVATEGEYAISPGTTKIKDIILKAGGVLYYSSNQAELSRITVTQSGPVTEFINIDINKALNDDPAHNIPLEMNDYLFVRTIPEWGTYETITITGEVKFPGTYTIKKNEKLSSLIERAGGYTDDAYLRGAVFTRERVKDIQKESLLQMADRLERELFSESSAKISTALSGEELSAKKSETEEKRKFIETLKEIEPTGRMTIRLGHLRLLKGTEYDIALEEGDNLVIPRKNSVVNVLGAVMSRGSFIYSNDFDHKDYIDIAGGFTKNADTNNVYVLKVDGTAMHLSSGFFNWNASKTRWDIEGFGEIKEIEPGDAIVVPEKFEHIAWLREIKDITQIFYQVAVATAVVLNLN